MDKKQIYGLFMIALILIIYSYYFAPKPPTPKDTSEKLRVSDTLTNSIYKDQIPIVTYKDSIESIKRDSVLQSEKSDKYGVFILATEGKEEEIVLENKDIKIDFSTKGGIIKRVLLKHFETYDSLPLLLLDETNNKISYKFSFNNRIIDLNDFYFKPSSHSLFEDKENSEVITMKLNITEEQFIELTYTLKGEGYKLKQNINFIGFDEVLNQPNNPIELSWNINLKRLEKDIKYNRQHATINYKYSNGDFEGLKESSMEPQKESLNTPVKWIAFKDKFFTSAILSAHNFESAIITCSGDEKNDSVVKSFTTKIYIPSEQLRTKQADFTFFFGPNNFLVLKNVTDGFEKNIYLGWGIFGWVNRYVIIPIFNRLDNYFTNYGLIIFLLVLIIKMGLFPLTYKSYLSMAKTRVLKPEMDAIKEKNKNDMAKSQAETMKLYKSAGVNPFGGCLPQLLQIPILFAMFTFFPTSIELRQKSFLWAHDLSTYDSVLNLPFIIPFYGDHVSLFTILMTASTLLYTWLNQQMTATNQQMKFLAYGMPVIFMFVLNSFPAALTYYYFLSNMITFTQMALIKRFVDEDKIRAQIDINKQKPPKPKSSFQKRLEDAAKSRGYKK